MTFIDSLKARWRNAWVVTLLWTQENGKVELLMDSIDLCSVVARDSGIQLHCNKIVDPGGRDLTLALCSSRVTIQCNRQTGRNVQQQLLPYSIPGLNCSHWRMIHSIRKEAIFQIDPSMCWQELSRVNRFFYTQLGIIFQKQSFDRVNLKLRFQKGFIVFHFFKVVRSSIGKGG